MNVFPLDATGTNFTFDMSSAGWQGFQTGVGSPGDVAWPEYMQRMDYEHNASQPLCYAWQNAADPIAGTAASSLTDDPSATDIERSSGIKIPLTGSGTVFVDYSHGFTSHGNCGFESGVPTGSALNCVVLRKGFGPISGSVVDMVDGEQGRVLMSMDFVDGDILVIQEFYSAVPRVAVL